MSEPQFFETITKGVNTAEFLEASENLVKIFGLFGNPAFVVVQNDITGNITKVRAYLTANPDSAKTLESLLAHEKVNGGKNKVATDGLMWLLRGLKFTALGLRYNLDNPSEELSASFTKSYEASLKKYHGIMVRPVFYSWIAVITSNSDTSADPKLAMKACPYRATFYPKLGQPESEVIPKLEAWLTALQDIVKKEEGVFKAGTYGEI